MFCNTKFGSDLITSNPKWFRYDLVWDKGHGVSFLSANKMPMKSHEMIYVFSKAGAYYKRINVKTDKKEWHLDKKNSKCIYSKQYNVQPKKVSSGGVGGMRCPLSVIPIGGKLAGGHPTQKPEELYEWLLSRYCPSGGTVLDPTAGSFNSIFVAKRLGLKGIGMEMDNDFFYKAVIRLLTARLLP
jgi:site-specific DNA-methyltransferase (adenine-specific)